MAISDQTRAEIERAQVRRLSTFTDCVYAVCMVLVIQWLPLPSESSVESGRIWVFDLLVEHAGNLTSVIIAIVFLILYWLRSTGHLARLQRSDGKHATLTILSVFSLLLLIYVIRLSGDLDPISSRMSESFSVALIGIFASAALWHAGKSGLKRQEIEAAEFREMHLESWTEPLTALLTMPFAFAGELWWNLAWLLYLPVSRLLKRRGRVA
jgi:uncharacterized membrane protein